MGERKIILVLSGEICSGKSTLADKLEALHGFKHCKTKEGLNYFASEKFKDQPLNRDFFQKFGEDLDTSGDGKCVLDYFQHLY